MNTNQRATNAYCSMMNKTFENIVGRVFINSIPISSDELTPEVRRDLTKYAVSAVESAGGINLLTNAIINETNPQKKNFMLQMFSICDTASKEVSDRVALEATRNSTPKTTAKTVKNQTSIAVVAVKESLKELMKRDDIKALFANNRNVKKCTKVSTSKSLTEVTVLSGSSEDIAKFKGFLKELNKLIPKKMPSGAGALSIKVDYNSGSILITPKNMTAKEARESAYYDFEFDPAMEAEDDVPDLTEKTEEDLKNESDDADDSDETENDDSDEKDTADDDEDDENKDDSDDDKKEDKAESPALTVRSLQTANVDAKMTDAEYEKFSSNVDSLDISKISNIVNDKVVNAIADEKNNYHAMDDSNARLKDAILKDDSVADDSAAESVMASILEIPKKKFQSEYQSLFSKLQLMAVESIALNPGIDMSRPDTGILTDITVNSTFDTFCNAPATEASLIDTLDKAMTMQSALEGADCDCDTEKFVALGTAFATIIMTLLETLHTMGFINPTTNDVKKIIDSDSTVAKSVASIKNDVDNKVDAALENNEKRINGYKSAGAVEAVLVNLGALKNKLIDATESGIDISFDTFTKVDALIEKARNKLTALENASSDITYDISNDRRHEEDIMKANRIQKYVAARKPDRTDFICTENANGIGVDISCYANDKVIYHSAMALEGTHNGITAEDYTNLILSKSKFGGMRGMRIRGKNKTINM